MGLRAEGTGVAKKEEEEEVQRVEEGYRGRVANNLKKKNLNSKLITNSSDTSYCLRTHVTTTPPPLVSLRCLCITPAHRSSMQHLI